MRGHWTWLAGCGVFVLICVAMLFVSEGYQFGSAKGGAGFVKSQKSLHFSDGESIEVLQFGLGEVVDGKASVGGGFFGGGSSSGSSGNGGSTVAYAKRDGVLEELTFRASNPGALVMEVQRGRPRLQMPYLHYNDYVYEMSGGGSRLEKFVGAEAVMAGATGPGVPDYVFQVRASNGEWLDGYQSEWSDEDPERRFAVIFRSWPRGQKLLDFRVLKSGGEVREFSHSNPTPSTVKTWSAQSVPAKYSDAECECVLESVEYRDVVGKGVKLIADFSQQSKIMVGGKSVLDAYTSTLEKVEGNVGSLGEYADPANRVFRLSYRLDPSDSYPYSRTGAVVLARAEVGAKGALQSVKTNSSILPVTKFSTARQSDGYQFEVDFHWKNAASMQRTRKALGVGDWEEAVACVFIDGSTHASGEVRSQGGGSSSSGYNVEANQHWYYEGELKTGQVIEFALVTPVPSKHVEFVVGREGQK
ncbi:hypothetical protein [Rubritalea tangerina]|uniref:Uncharacterized protein n=1 Tax=Rubritalea tangerina TaxID=430798 RepID=A0ABW4ZFX6_9BACT